jgi:dTDP-4-dehydrorhamnose reductase
MLATEVQTSAVLPSVGGKDSVTTTVWVTGAGGLLGTALCARLAREGHRVIPHTRSGPTGFSFEELDRIEPAVRAARPDWIIHAAGNTNLDACEADPASAQRLHVAASREIARAAARHGCRMVYVSTDSVYPGEQSGSHGEDGPVAPVNQYACTKLAGEQACLAVLGSTIIARVNFFGLHPSRPQGLAAWLAESLRAGRSIRGFTDVRFNPLGTGDLADLLIMAMDRGLPGGIYNFGASEACSKFDFARRFAVRLGADPALIQPAVLAEAKLTTPRPRNTVMHVGKLSAALQRTMPSFEEGITGLFTS